MIVTDVPIVTRLSIVDADDKDAATVWAPLTGGASFGASGRSPDAQANPKGSW